MKSTMDDWIKELKSAIGNRIREANPKIKKRELKQKIDIKISECNKWWHISVMGKERFLVEKKTGIIYGSHKEKAKRKECYDRLEDWQQWDWKPFYPYRKSLYEWENEKAKESIGRAKELIGGCSIDKILEGKIWPYTTDVSRRSRRKKRNDTTMGNDPDAENGNRPASVPGSNRATEERKRDNRKP